MKKIIALFSAVVLSFFTYAQDLDFKWGGLLKSTGTGQAPSINDIDRDTLGNYYVVGTIYQNDTVDFDIKAGVLNKSTEANRAAFIAKYSNTGDLTWVRSIEGSGSTEAISVLVRPTQDVLIGGNYNGTTEFDPAGSIQLSTATATDYYILRLNPAGQYVSHNASALNGNQYFGKLKQDKNGAVYYSLKDEGAAAVATVVFKSSTNSSWQYYVSTQGTSIQNTGDFAVDTAGNVYLVGGYRGTLYYNPANSGQVITSSSSFTQPYVIKISPSGQYIFNQNIGCDGASSGVCVATDEASNVYFGGYIKNTNSTNFGNGFTFSSPTAENTFLVKYNPAGQAQWLKQLVGAGVSVSNFIDLDKRGNIYVSGYYRDTVDFNPDTLLTSNLANTRYTPFVLKLTKEGNLSGIADLKAKADGFFNSVKVINDEVLSVGRFSTDTVDLNLGAAASIFTANQVGQTSPFIAKHTFASCPTTASATSTGLTVNIADAVSYEWFDCATNLPLASANTQSIVLSQNTTALVQIEKGFCSTESECANFVLGTNVGINEVANTIKFSVYPNPANESVSIENLPLESQIKLVDIAGKIIYQSAVNNSIEKIDLQSIASGIYFINVLENGTLKGTSKLVVSK